MEFTIDLATPADDAAIRRILATNPLPGNVALSYEREPDFFAGCGVTGQFWQVLAAHTSPGGELAGFATRAVRRRYVNGVERDVGYLGQLRVDHRFRGHGLSGRAYQRLRELHEDGRTPFYLATIIEGNMAALRLLVERPIPGGPRFREVGRMLTLALLARPRRPARPPGVELTWGAGERLPDVASFLERHLPHRQLAPVYGEPDLRGSALTRGLRPDDLCVATRGGAIVGVLGLWDQSAYKQTVVRGYGGWLGRLRPLYNLAARAARVSPLPAPGGHLHTRYAAPLCVAHDDPAVFDALLRVALGRAALQGAAHLLVGLAVQDPLLPIARRYLHVPYRSRVYLASWEDQPSDDALDGRVPYLEIASL